MPNVHNMRDTYLIAVVICMRFSVSIISSLEDNFVKPSKLTMSNVTTAELADTFSITSLETNCLRSDS